jgi:hypothetical protein
MSVQAEGRTADVTARAGRDVMPKWLTILLIVCGVFMASGLVLLAFAWAHSLGTR